MGGESNESIRAPFFYAYEKGAIPMVWMKEF
jgi:hypothetical protein